MLRWTVSEHGGRQDRKPERDYWMTPDQLKDGRIAFCSHRRSVAFVVDLATRASFKVVPIIDVILSVPECGDPILGVTPNMTRHMTNSKKKAATHSVQFLINRYSIKIEL